MIAIGLLFARMLRDLFKPRLRLEAEILILRHQLNVLQQRTPRRRLHLRRRYPRILDALSIVRPETVVRWHRKGFTGYWRCKSRSPGLQSGQWPIPPRYHVDGNHGLGDRDAEFEQFIDMHESEFSEATAELPLLCNRAFGPLAMTVNRVLLLSGFFGMLFIVVNLLIQGNPIPLYLALIFLKQTC